jgi:hypothetical protein
MGGAKVTIPAELLRLANMHQTSKELPELGEGREGAAEMTEVSSAWELKGLPRTWSGGRKAVNSCSNGSYYVLTVAKGQAEAQVTIFPPISRGDPLYLCASGSFETLRRHPASFLARLIGRRIWPDSATTFSFAATSTLLSITERSSNSYSNSETECSRLEELVEMIDGKSAMKCCEEAGDGEMVEWVTTRGEVIVSLPRKMVHSFNLLHRGVGVLVLYNYNSNSNQSSPPSAARTTQQSRLQGSRQPHVHRSALAQTNNEEGNSENKNTDPGPDANPNPNPGLLGPLQSLQSPESAAAGAQLQVLVHRRSGE